MPARSEAVEKSWSPCGVSPFVLMCEIIKQQCNNCGKCAKKEGACCDRSRCVCVLSVSLKVPVFKRDMKQEPTESLLVSSVETFLLQKKVVPVQSSYCCRRESNCVQVTGV